MYLTISNRLRDALAAFIQKTYSVKIPVVLEKPPKLEMGEAASPVCFELAKRLKKAPRAIAQEIAVGLPKPEGIARVEVAGGGYLNAFFDRAAIWHSLVEEQHAYADLQKAAPQPATKPEQRVIVEHTSINPNKAAHIGHVRNAVLGDTMVRLLRNSGQDVVVQNYIDNTGVQVADVVIAFQQMEKKSLAEVPAARGPASLRLPLLGPVRQSHAILRSRQTSRRHAPRRNAESHRSRDRERLPKLRQ